VALFILLIAIGLEYLSLRRALTIVQQEQEQRSLWQWFKDTHSSELVVVVGEDLALTGLSIALVMLWLTLITGNIAFDAVGSILIGLLLIVVAFVIGIKVHSLLLGEAAGEIRDDIQRYLENQPIVIGYLI
jgi:divalent metal cation (Fe/Co/Zn/Cd) transporter